MTRPMCGIERRKKDLTPADMERAVGPRAVLSPKLGRWPRLRWVGPLALREIQVARRAPTWNGPLGLPLISQWTKFRGT